MITQSGYVSLSSFFSEMGMASKWVKPHSWFVVWYKVHFFTTYILCIFLHSLYDFCMSCIDFYFFKFKFSTIFFRAFEHNFWLTFVFSQFWAGISILFLMIYCKYCDWRVFFLFFEKNIVKEEFFDKIKDTSFVGWI